MDPALVAVAGALSAVAGVLYRELSERAKRAEADARFWRDRALGSTGLAELAVREAERRSQP